MTVAPIVFLHIPKCSGIALSHAVLTARPSSHAFLGFDRAFFGSFSDFDSLAAENRALVHCSPNTIPHGETYVRAHASLSTLRAAFPGGRFMTVLREPSCRILSHFAFWRSFDPQEDAAWGGWAARSGLARGSLEDFLSSGEIACQIDNIATRLLLWPHPLIPDGAPIAAEHDSELLAAAHARLATMDFVDAVENPAMYTNLGAWLGTTLNPSRHNETELMPAGLRTRLDRELTPRALDLLAARSRLDLVLWQSVLRGQLDVGALRIATIQRGFARTALLLGSGQA